MVAGRSNAEAVGKYRFQRGSLRVKRLTYFKTSVTRSVSVCQSEAWWQKRRSGDLDRERVSLPLRR